MGHVQHTYSVALLWVLAALALGLPVSCVPDGQGSEGPSDGDTASAQGDGGFASATVVEVLDGTTVDVQLDGRVYRVRYLGIDVPDAAAQRALEFNRFAVEGESVALEKDAIEADQAGRLLRYVYVHGEMVNKALLVNGYAAVASYPPGFKYQSEFLLAQEQARAAMRGIWQPPGGHGPAPSSGSPTPDFGFGTLPPPPDAGGAAICDYSDTATPAIKGKAGPVGRVYHVPGDPLYSATFVDESHGDRWFCTEAEAIAAGWRRAAR